MSSTEGPANDHEEQVLAAQLSSREAIITVHQDPGAAGRVMFSIDLSNDGVAPDAIVDIPTCDIVALTLFNLAMKQAEAFNTTYAAVIACINELTDAQQAGADPEALRAIRERHGVQFRVG